MKKQLLSTLVTILTVASTFGQISTTKVAPVSDNAAKTPYDSTKNFLGKDVDKYLGLELYVKGKAKSLRDYGYRDFVLDYKNDKLTDQSNIYKRNDKYATKYDELAGKYFKVLEIIKHPKAASNEELYGSVFYFKLEEKETKDIVYFKYDSRFEIAYPFIIVAYFEKQKQYIGRDFVLLGKNSFNIGKPTNDFKTGKEVDITTGCVWKVKDVTIEETYFDIALGLENEKGESIFFDLDNISDEDFILPKATALNYKKTFGDEIWNLILNGKVKIGMTKKMCILSWREPESKNETITAGKKSEQWVYKGGSYLYFDNGILTAIQ